VEAQAEAAAVADAIETEKAATAKETEVVAAAAAAEANVGVSAAAKARAKEAEAKEAHMAKDARENKKGTATTKQHVQNDDPPPDLVRWELSEGCLPTRSTLSGSKALLNEYPEDEAKFQED
jgi:hypothetical protein